MVVSARLFHLNRKVSSGPVESSPGTSAFLARGFVLLNIVYAYFVDRCRKSKIWGWENPFENREMGGHRSYHHQTSTRERALSKSFKIQIEIRASVGSRTGYEISHSVDESVLLFYSYSLA